MLRRLVALSLLLTLSGCASNYDWRQKLTLLVSTPTGEVSGAAVVAINARFLKDPPIGNEVFYKVRGEAAVAEIAPGRYLFALLGNEAERFHCAAPERFKDMSRGRWLSRIPRQKEPTEVPRNCIPGLVTFDDISDPTSVRRVDPDDLDGAFGCDRAAGHPEPPWRASGQYWKTWRKEEAMRRAKEGASARAGLTGDVAAALTERGQRYRPNYASAEQTAMLERLRKRFTYEDYRAWDAARFELYREFLDTLPTPEEFAAPYGGPCHRLLPPVLAITKEPVTEGVLDGLLGWLGPYPERALLPNLNPHDFSFAAQRRQGEFIRR